MLTGARQYSVAGLVVFGATAFTATLNLLYGVLAARLLGPSLFGEYASLVVIGGIVTTAAGGIQATTAREVARTVDEPSRRDTWLRRSLMVSIAIMVLLLVVSPIVSAALRTSLLNLLPVAATAPAAVIVAVALGRLIGTERTALWNAVGIAVTSVKFSLGVTFGLIFASVAVFLWGSVVAALLVGVVALYMTRHVSLRGLRLRSPAIWTTTGVILLLWFCLQADIIFARIILAAEDAGSYSAAAALTKSTVLVLGLAGTIVLPRVSRLLKNSESPTSLLMRLNFLVMALAVGGSAVLWMFGDALYAAIYGAQFSTPPSLLAACMIAAIPWAGTAAMVNAWMGSRALRALLVGGLIFASLQIICLALVSSSVTSFVIVFGVFGIASNVLVGVYAQSRRYS